MREATFQTRPSSAIDWLDMPRAGHPLWFRAAAAYLVLAAFCALVIALDARTLNDVSVWSKPFKFSLSLVAYFLTLAWFAPLLPQRYYEGTVGRTLTVTAVTVSVFEMTYIVAQAARGEPSHFNVSTPFHAAMYSLMGFGATLLVLVCLWVGVRILLHQRFASPLALASGLGLILTCLQIGRAHV